MSNGLEGLGPDLRAWLTQVVREDGVGRPMKAIQDGINLINPVRTGRHRHSYTPWSGSEPTDAPPAAPFLPPLGHDAIDGALAPFQLGDRAGFTNLQPYSGFLLSGGSPQAPDLEADLDNLLAEVVLA